MFVRAIDNVGEKKFLESPPDVFAVCAKIARLTGCYLHYADSEKGHLDGVKFGVSDGKIWAELLSRNRFGKREINKLPERIERSWEVVCSRLRDYEGSSLDFSMDDLAAAAVLYLIVATDSACEKIGIPVGGYGGYFGIRSSIKLVTEGTLCKYLGSRYGRVLPKRHTPKFGLNLRNLTRHIAYCEESEVSIEWFNRDYDSKSDGRTSFNLMVVPWPFEVSPTSLIPSARASSSQGMGYFDYSPSPRRGNSKAASSEIYKLVKSAIASGHRVDLVVLPECSLSEKDWGLIKKALAAESVGVLAGVYGKSDGGLMTNSVRLNLGGARDEVRQYKHHRWKIEKNQISNYGLGGDAVLFYGVVGEYIYS